MVFQRKVDWEAEVETMKELGAQGVSMTGLAEKYGVSRQRIKQVTKRLIPNWSDEYGFAARRANKARLFEAKWGKKEGTQLYRSQRAKFWAKKNNAQRTGHEWSIEFGDLEWPSHCPILGIELDYFTEFRAESSVSFDQIDPGKGYVKGNVRIMSWRANRLKNNGTAEEHRKIADWLDSLYN